MVRYITFSHNYYLSTERYAFYIAYKNVYVFCIFIDMVKKFNPEIIFYFSTYFTFLIRSLNKSFNSLFKIF